MISQTTALLALKAINIAHFAPFKPRGRETFFEELGTARDG